ncbi:hypothetical protein AC519_3336 [Pseudomonas savastanoi]|nr:hypothetical protein AC519_3336 [Pseudomonas savastanoi]
MNAWRYRERFFSNERHWLCTSAPSRVTVSVLLTERECA